jgi:preprotein translocase subunit SecE
MAKTISTGGDEQPFKNSKALSSVTDKWNEMTRFLSDVRAEMRKVVAPGRKEVQVTTSVVLITVMIFGAYFFVTDFVFRTGMNALLSKLGGM